MQGFNNYSKIFDTKYTNITRMQACDLIEKYISLKQEFYYVAVKDTDLIVRCYEDEFLRDFYNTIPKNIFVCGRGTFYFSFLLRKPLKEMVGGPGIFLEMLKRSQKKEYKIYFLGSSQSILEKTVKNVEKRLPGIKIVGNHNGYFNDKEESFIIRDINNSGCDILFIGISTPKREIFMRRNISSFENMVCIPVGGMFDVEAGEKKLAPMFISYLGMEWFYRFIQEPKRMFKRYFYSHTKIFYYFVQELIH